MKYEVLKRSHLKRNIVVALIVVGVISAIILNFTQAKYKTTQSLPLINGTINYELSDFNLIGAYIQEGEEYKQTNEIPSVGYEFNSDESYCTVNGENINATINFDIETQTLSVVPLTKKGTKCYLYFDEKSSGSEYILASPNAPTNHTTDWTGEESYYYTGNPNNWVSFAGFYWRIIRINGDGSIRMIYNGSDATGPATSGVDTQIGMSSFNSINDNYIYVGYMYEKDQLHGLKDSSTVKGILDNWYLNNLTDEAEYINRNAGFCGDRILSSQSGMYVTIYEAETRIQNSNPDLKCEQIDIYTTIDSTTGNNALTYPIGLISADEAMFAGLPYTYNTGNKNNYLYTEQFYWTMTPKRYNGYPNNNDQASIFRVGTNGELYGSSANWSAVGVRPVINIKADTQITGSGTSTDPYTLSVE